MTLLPVRPIATINAVDESRLLDEVCRVLEGGGDREQGIEPESIQRGPICRILELPHHLKVVGVTVTS
jgi:hypothetical protein